MPGLHGVIYTMFTLSVMTLEVVSNKSHVMLHRFFQQGLRTYVAMPIKLREMLVKPCGWHRVGCTFPTVSLMWPRIFTIMSPTTLGLLPLLISISWTNTAEVLSIERLINILTKIRIH